MMDLYTIRDMSREAAKTAKRIGKQPFVFKEGNVTIDQLANIPNLGTHRPFGWERVSLENKADKCHGIKMGDNDGFGAYFVDASGFGRPDEPALTVDEFLKQIVPGLGYGIVEVGQFQIKIGVFAVRTA